jgi:hypothetical protein
MIVYGCVALVGTCLLAPIKPRFWTTPRERRLEAGSQQPATAAG